MMLLKENTRVIPQFFLKLHLLICYQNSQVVKKRSLHQSLTGILVKAAAPVAASPRSLLNVTVERKALQGRKTKVDCQKATNKISMVQSGHRLQNHLRSPQAVPITTVLLSARIIM